MEDLDPKTKDVAAVRHMEVADLHDSLQSHGDCLMRDIFLSKKIRSSINPGDLVKGD